MQKTIITLLTLATLTACGSSNKINNAKIISCSASSTLEPFSGRYAVNKLFDGTVKTCWSEGVSGPGIGTRIIIRFNKKVTINKLYIVNGLGISKYHKKNNRVKQLRINRQLVTLKDSKAGKYQTVVLPKTIKSSWIIIEIVSVYKTSKWNDTCLSEIAFSKHKKKKIVSPTTRFTIDKWSFARGGMGGARDTSYTFYANNKFEVTDSYGAPCGASHFSATGKWSRRNNTIRCVITQIHSDKFNPDPKQSPGAKPTTTGLANTLKTTTFKIIPGNPPALEGEWGRFKKRY